MSTKQGSSPRVKPPIRPRYIGETVREDSKLDLAIRQSFRARRQAKHRRRIIILGSQILIIAAVLGLWEFLSRSGAIDPLFFSRPSAIGSNIVHNFSLLMTNAGYTFEAAVIGFALASAAGVLVGIILAGLKGVADALEPIIIFINSLPRIAFVPLFILWFGITVEAKIATAFSLVFFIVLINTQVGLYSVDREILLVTKLLGGSPAQVYFKVALPAAVPAIFAGLRLGVTYSILGVVASEMVASRNGLGQLVATDGQNLDSAGVFATLAVLGLLAAILSAILRIIEHRLSKWKTSGN
jgi:NitT/TauT family transport system permease protein